MTKDAWVFSISVFSDIKGRPSHAHLSKFQRRIINLSKGRPNVKDIIHILTLYPFNCSRPLNLGTGIICTYNYHHLFPTSSFCNLLFYSSPSLDLGLKYYWCYRLCCVSLHEIARWMLVIVGGVLKWTSAVHWRLFWTQITRHVGGKKIQKKKRIHGRPSSEPNRNCTWTTSSSWRTEESWRSTRTTTSCNPCAVVHGSTDFFHCDFSSSVIWKFQLWTRVMVALDQVFRRILKSKWARTKGRQEPEEDAKPFKVSVPRKVSCDRMLKAFVISQMQWQN